MDVGVSWRLPAWAPSFGRDTLAGVTKRAVLSRDPKLVLQDPSGTNNDDSLRRGAVSLGVGTDEAVDGVSDRSELDRSPGLGLYDESDTKRERSSQLAPGVLDFRRDALVGGLERSVVSRISELGRRDVSATFRDGSSMCDEWCSGAGCVLGLSLEGVFWGVENACLLE
jgi:hypothetical protein